MCEACNCGSLGNDKKVAIKIEGIDSPDCVEKIERILSRLLGVSRVHVHASDGRTWITYNPDYISMEEIEKQLEFAGYKLNNNITMKDHFLRIFSSK